MKNNYICQHKTISKKRGIVLYFFQIFLVSDLIEDNPIPVSALHPDWCDIVLAEVYEENLASQIWRWRRQNLMDFLKGSLGPSGVFGPHSENC